MSSIWRHLFGVVAAALLVAPGPGRADMGKVAAEPAKPSSGSALLKRQDIRLDAVEVTLKLKKTHYVVYGTFHFFNTDETKTLSIPFGESWMVFPIQVLGDPRLERVDRWVNGKKVDDPEDSPWMLRDVVFRGHEPTTLRVRYEAGYPLVDGDRNKRCVVYPLGPTRMWKDFIGRAVYTVDGSDLGGREPLSSSLSMHYRTAGTKGHDVPSRTDQNKNTVRYEIRDFWPFGMDILSGCVKK